VDHDIELPADRVARGGPPRGTISSLATACTTAMSNDRGSKTVRTPDESSTQPIHEADLTSSICPGSIR
jgi:hypothetical protein